MVIAISFSINFGAINKIASYILLVLCSFASKVKAQTIQPKLPFDSIRGSYVQEAIQSKNLDSVQKHSSLFLDSSFSFSEYLRQQVSASGMVTMESFMTNYQDPYSLAEKQYLRLYGNTGLNFGLLPVNIDFYYSTESNLIYNSNYIRASIDFQRLGQNARQRLETKINEQLAKKKSEMEALSKIEARKRMLRNKTDSLKSITSNLELSIKTELSDSVETFSKQLSDTLNNQEKSLKSKNDQKQDISDSIIQIQSKIDSLEVLANSYQSAYDQQKNKVDSLSKTIATYEEKMKNGKLMDDYIPAKYSKIVQRFITQSKSLNIGISSVYMEKYSLNGTSIKGLNYDGSFDKFDLSIALGRTFQAEYLYDRTKPIEYNRNVIGIKATHKLSKSFEIDYHEAAFWQPSSQNTQLNNFISGFGFRKQWNKKLSMELQSFHSYYISGDTATVITKQDELSLSNYQKFTSQLAFKSQINYDVNKWLNINGQYERINPGFITLGNLYLRSNFHETTISSKVKAFKNKIRFEGFYKHLNDNIMHLTEVSNTVRGYGFSARSHFSEGLNFFVQYTPYIQGNNHPDTLFRTDNQLSVKTALINYQKRVNSSYITSSLTIVSSSFDFKQKVMVRSLLYSANASYLSKIGNIGIAISRNVTGPLVDTLNFWGYRADAQLNIKSFHVGGMFYLDKFDIGAVRYESTLSLGVQVKRKLDINLQASTGHISKLYGIEEINRKSIRFILTYIM